MNEKSIEQNIVQMLKDIGEDIMRDGLVETPKRVARMYTELFNGIETVPDKHLKLFDSEGNHDLILCRGIRIFSVCEHHMLPFGGVCNVGYIPDKKIIGLSKIPRIVECFSKRLQVQERLTMQICDYLMDKLEPLGVIVHIEAEHMCVVMRGVKAAGASTVTLARRGCFDVNQDRVNEFLRLI